MELLDGNSNSTTMQDIALIQNSFMSDEHKQAVIGYLKTYS
jgi:hypothetical protein